MENPLNLLRQYNINKKEIIERDNQIIFGDLSGPKNTRTNYQIKTGKNYITKEYYTLECLFYFLKNTHLKQPVYRMQALAANVPAVRRPDRKPLLKYLNGETDTSASIDENISLEKPTKVKRKHENENVKFKKKKPRFQKRYYVQKVKMGDNGELVDEKPHTMEIQMQKIKVENDKLVESKFDNEETNVKKVKKEENSELAEKVPLIEDTNVQKVKKENKESVGKIPQIEVTNRQKVKGEDGELAEKKPSIELIHLQEVKVDQKLNPVDAPW